MAFESNDNQEEGDEEAVVNLEAELVAALEEVDILRKTIRKQKKEIDLAKEREREVIKKALQDEAEIKVLQEQIRKASLINLNFENSTADLDKLISQQRQPTD